MFRERSKENVTSQVKLFLTNEGAAVSEESEHQETQPAKSKLCIMMVPSSQDEHVPPCGSTSGGTIKQYGSSQSSSQHGGAHLSSNGNISAAEASAHLEPKEYTETDYLLPDKLYGRSRLSKSTNDAQGSSAPTETVCSMVLQILVPFLLSGFGTVSAGMLLDVVQVRK